MIVIGAQIASVVATASATARQAEQATSNGAGGAVSLATASQAARQAVTDFENEYHRKLDPYLHFASPEDEERYRREEAERKAEIEKAMALHTPQGDLRANKLALDQLNDAGVHGATASPDFETMRQRLQASQTTLSAAITSADPARAQAAPDAGTRDIADDVSPSVSVPSSVLAALRSVKPADPSTEGHGVSTSKPSGVAVGLSG